jgi:hypothetical protein
MVDNCTDISKIIWEWDDTNKEDPCFYLNIEFNHTINMNINDINVYFNGNKLSILDRYKANMADNKIVLDVVSIIPEDIINNIENHNLLISIIYSKPIHPLNVVNGVIYECNYKYEDEDKDKECVIRDEKSKDKGTISLSYIVRCIYNEEGSEDLISRSIEKMIEEKHTIF